MPRLIALAALWVLLAGAAAPLPLTAPPPGLTRLVPFIQASLDKPRVEVPEVALPGPPVEMPPLPPAPLVWPVAERPTAFMTAPRGYPCAVALLPIASQALECGKERFLKGDYADAAKAFESAVQRASERDLQIQSRYWFGESLVKQGKFEQADWQFRQVVGDTVGLEYEVWAANAGGWMALRLQDPARARDTFTKLLAGAVPAAIQGWARHGMALAHYALGSYAEAERVWAEMGRRGVPPPLAREYAFWFGEVSGRIGEHARAEEELRKFTQGADHPLLATGLVRLGWWMIAGGRVAESVAPFRAYLGGPRRPASSPDLDWAEAGLALALGGSGDWSGARDAARALASRKSALALPVALRLARAALDAKKTAETQVIVQDLLAGTITPAVRAWLLLTKGDAQRLEGNRDEARTQYELGHQADPSSALGQQATLRLARTNFEMREFAQAVRDVSGLLAALQAPEIRVAALLLQGEAAYHASNLAVAEAAFRRALVEFAQHAQAPAVRLSLAWVALRQNQRDEARRLFLEFARALPEHGSAADALVLGAELAIASGDLDAARRELDRIIGAYPMHSRTDFARLNRAILLVRLGQVAEAQPALRDWITRAPFPPLLGRASATLGAALLASAQPAEAAKQFAVAQREGVGAFASLGLGAAALAQGRLDDAARALTEARDTGTAEITATAEYALAAVALQKGAVRDFKQPALNALGAAPGGPMAPRLLYILSAIAVEETDWAAALDAAKKLVAQFPDDEAADDALERIGAASAKVTAWPVVYEAYSLMKQRYASSPFLDGARFLLAEAQLRTGRPDETRRDLEQLLAAPTPAAHDAQPWILLARARETTGDRRGAVEAYARAARESKGPASLREAQLGQVRLLMLDRRWSEARAVLDRLLRSDERSLVLEAAFSIGETYRNEGDQLAAAEYYMTAGYLAPESAYGRKSLLAAAQGFAAAKAPGAAVTVYRKLLAQSDLPGDLADAARQGLQALGQR